MDDSFAKGYTNEGILVGVLRHFKEDKTILNITDASSGSIYWSLQNDGDYSVISCQSGNLGKRYTITKDMSDLNNCLKNTDFKVGARVVVFARETTGRLLVVVPALRFQPRRHHVLLLGVGVLILPQLNALS